MLEHPNRDRSFKKGELINARPGMKSHRKDIPEDLIVMAKEMRKLIRLFKLTEEQINDIIRNHFGEGVGFQTTRMFMDQTYGPGFRLRWKTRNKYQFLIDYLKKLKKQFAKSEN